MKTTESTEEAGERAFARYARRIAKIERAADLAPGSLAEAMIAGLFDQNNSASEWAGWIGNGWDCEQSPAEIEAALAPVVAKWTEAESP